MLHKSCTLLQSFMCPPSMSSEEMLGTSMPFHDGMSTLLIIVINLRWAGKWTMLRLVEDLPFGLGMPCFLVPGDPCILTGQCSDRYGTLSIGHEHEIMHRRYMQCRHISALLFGLQGTVLKGDARAPCFCLCWHCTCQVITAGSMQVMDRAQLQ